MFGLSDSVLLKTLISDYNGGVVALRISEDSIPGQREVSFTFIGSDHVGDKNSQYMGAMAEMAKHVRADLKKRGLSCSMEAGGYSNAEGGYFVSVTIPERDLAKAKEIQASFGRSRN